MLKCEKIHKFTPYAFMTSTPQHLVELREVEEVGSMSVNQGTEGQAILPASPADKQREQSVSSWETSRLQHQTVSVI